MSLRTPRHDYGPTATPARYATPRGNPLLASSLNGGPNTPAGPSSSAMDTHSFDFLAHPIFSDPEALQSGLQFEGLYSKMAVFKEKINSFVEESYARLDEAKENQNAIKEDYKVKIKKLESQTEAEKKAQKELFAAIAEEREEDAEARRVQSEKERYSHSLSSQLSDIQSELDEMRKQFMLRREEKKRVAGKMREMAKLNIPERELLESRTGLRIGTPGPDQISFTFSHLDPDHPHEKAFFVFALQKRTYTVLVVQPPIPQATLTQLLAELNSSRQAFKFIKQMRRLLKEQIQAGARARGTADDNAWST